MWYRFAKYIFASKPLIDLAMDIDVARMRDVHRKINRGSSVVGQMIKEFA